MNHDERKSKKVRYTKKDWYAVLYGLRLREQGYTTYEAAACVVERYPHTAERLKPLILEKEKECG